MFPYRGEIDLRIGPLAVGGGEGTRHARDRDHRDAEILGLAAGVNRAVAADGERARSHADRSPAERSRRGCPCLLKSSRARDCLWALVGGVEWCGRLS